MKRIVLFLATNRAIVLVLSFTARLLTAIMGMSGAFISLAISKWSAKHVGGELKRLFMPHPPLAERIAALQQAQP